MSNPSNTDSANMRWQFIDSSNNSRSNLTQVKRHVMQEYMRQKKSSPGSDSEEEGSHQSKRSRPKKTSTLKRKSAKKKDESDGADPANHPKCKVQYRDEAVPVENNWFGIPAAAAAAQLHDVAASLPFRTSSQSHDFSMSQTHNPTSWSSAQVTPFDLSLSPRTVMSAARTDPFNTLPIDLDAEGQQLFDFYVNTMPACSYGTHFRTSKAHNWYTAVFVPEGMKGAVAFQNTILVHAASTWAWVRNEKETPLILLHRDRAITMLREHLSNNPLDNSDVAIISCLSAAALEDFDPRPGHKEISWIHMRAARAMIRSRGGPDAFANTRLGMLINWQDYILSGYETHGPSFFYEDRPPLATIPAIEPVHHSFSQPPHSMPSPPESPSSAPTKLPHSSSTPTILKHDISPTDEIRLQCEEFLDFLRRCEQLSLYQRDNPESCDRSRRMAVQEHSILFQVLTAPPSARFTASGDRKQMVARLTALIILNAALWDYRYTPVLARTFVNTLKQAMIDSEVSESGSVEAILQILLSCNDGHVGWSTTYTPDFSQYSPTATSPSARPWFAGRMLKVAKRLNADSWHRLTDFLFLCLTLQVSESTIYTWESDLRREILAAPLTNYVMPSLMY
ncbi:hypothetical protein N7495_007908 [Penicillium taxi]|uniref:uncharacterized protein n=1 Tax=Penicillium taxi TaxID=168475 RepID=UPI0025453579|nr:uncharacterized protein N7495_007908 [Penicillium taxi]KAJ5887867.1 hypothetical protein N7495_007908 [Penicillium taxi]